MSWTYGCRTKAYLDKSAQLHASAPVGVYGFKRVLAKILRGVAYNAFLAFKATIQPVGTCSIYISFPNKVLLTPGPPSQFRTQNTLFQATEDSAL